ncbi:hypothetical protein KPL78_29450 [Roseomonas sp. HJA6]|uniref:Uncharacterized protein n=1 Tax=Roseomonas alba TaxID=2846776 RepID=A0ABS7AIL0_9PROT|nr:hypothetical protein [Neoroseomonas alba]MBW6402008.1 hypothetical protein [Neoroseomonas alba]
MSMPTTISVFGDSHSAFFFEVPFFAGRLGLASPPPYRITGQHIPGASVAGFRPGQTKLKVKETIRRTLPSATHAIFAFGQVDLELGYYYRNAIKQEKVVPKTYVEWLIGIYEEFLSDLDDAHCRVALKGVNLTTLAPRPFAARYVARIVMEGTTVTAEQAQKLIGPFILSEDAQNAMHLDFNAALAALAQRTGRGYFDLVAQTGNGNIRGLSAAPPRLADHFRTAKLDHHLADTVVVRRLHVEAAGRAFGLI